MYKISTDPLTGKTTIAAIINQTVIFFTSDSPLWSDYQTWIAEGNTPEEWNSDAD